MKKLAVTIIGIIISITFMQCDDTPVYSGPDNDSKNEETEEPPPQKYDILYQVGITKDKFNQHDEITIEIYNGYYKSSFEPSFNNNNWSENIELEEGATAYLKFIYKGPTVETVTALIGKDGEQAVSGRKTGDDIEIVLEYDLESNH